MVLLDALYIGVQSKMRMARDKAREFFASQQGVANVVATIIVLLIVVLLIGVFWDRLKEWVRDGCQCVEKRKSRGPWRSKSWSCCPSQS